MARVIFRSKKLIADAHRRVALGLAIKIARTRRRLRQQDLAERAEIRGGKVRISLLEAGKSRITHQELARIEEVLRIKLSNKRFRVRRTVSALQFGRAVEHARKQMGVTTRALAARLEIWGERLYRIESGEFKPRPDEVAKLEKALGIKLPEPAAYCRVYPPQRSATI